MRVLIVALLSVALLRPLPAASRAAATTASPSNLLGSKRAVDQAVPVLQGMFGTPVTFATHAQLAGYGFSFGPADGAFGAIPAGNGIYTFYAAAGSTTACAGTPNARSGAFTFSGTLDQVTGSNCTRLFGPGDGPAGWVFDQDYAGGGEVVPFTTGGKSGWLMPFHGELWWSNPAAADRKCGGVSCFYSSLGLAVSTDSGKTFQVAGQILQPSQPLSVFVGGGTNLGIGFGSLVVADANGQHLDNPPADPTSAYFYLFYSDVLAGSPGSHLGVARAPYGDAVAAALSGNPDQVATLFRKYDGGSPDPWTQPATSDTRDESGTAGTFAPLWTDEGASQPDVIYDSAFNIYLAAYESGAPFGAHFTVRASSDLIHWSEPIGAPYSEPGHALYQPTFIGETGDPTIAGSTPRVYFTSFPAGAFPNWTNSVFESVPLTLTAGPGNASP